MDKFYFSKLYKDVKTPSKRVEDGCYDLYAYFEEEYLTIPAFTIKLIPTGFATSFNSKYRIALRERGSNTKSGLNVRAGQIDSGFRGQYFVAVYNGNNVPVHLTKAVDEVVKLDEGIYVPYGKAICQFAIEEVPQIEWEEMPYEELKLIPSERGMGMIGDSGK